MWVHVEEEKYVNDTLFSDIRKNFASKVAPSRQPIHDLVDKSKELRVLDAKAAQNFGSIFFLLSSLLSLSLLFSDHVQSTQSSTINLPGMDAFM